MVPTTYAIVSAVWILSAGSAALLIENGDIESFDCNDPMSEKLTISTKEVAKCELHEDDLKDNFKPVDIQVIQKADIKQLKALRCSKRRTRELFHCGHLVRSKCQIPLYVHY